MSDAPSTSWAKWAWEACGEGRLVEVSEVRLQVFGLTARAEAAEAERDRLREALAVDPWFLGRREWAMHIRFALKGESHE